MADELPQRTEYSVCMLVLMMVYIPMWFEIKGNSYVQKGARHLYKTAILMKEQINEVQDVFFPVLKRNGYFTHPENILFSMISVSRPSIRELAWRRFKNTCAARKVHTNRPSVFKVPKLVVDCGIDYINTIKWKSVEVTE